MRVVIPYKGAECFQQPGSKSKPGVGKATPGRQCVVPECAERSCRGVAVRDEARFFSNSLSELVLSVKMGARSLRCTLVVTRPS